MYCLDPGNAEGDGVGVLQSGDVGGDAIGAGAFHAGELEGASEEGAGDANGSTLMTNF